MTDIEEETLARNLHGRPLPPQQPDIGRRSVELARRMRRRRGGTAIVMAIATASVATFAVSPALLDTTAQPAGPAAPPPSSAVVPSETALRYALPVSAECEEVAGDNVGDPDLTSAALDRPDLPFLHFSWSGTLPRTGSVRVLLEATSADGQRSRQFVVDLVDQQAVRQFIRDGQTGEVTTVDHEAPSGGVDDDGVPERVVNVLPTEGLSASFPVGSTRALGDRWAWELSLTVDGVVVDSCKAAR